MVSLVVGGFLLTWVAFALWSFKKKPSRVVSIGGGFLTACAVLILATCSVEFIEGTLRLPATFNFAVDQFKYLSFWLATALVLIAVFPRLIAFVQIIPLVGAVAGYLIAMPIIHATLMVYGILLGFGVTENNSLIGAGIFVLIITFCLAYWVAVDNVRKGNYGMS